MLAGGAPAGDCQGDLRRRRRGPAEGSFPEEVQVCAWLKVISLSPAGTLAGDGDACRRRGAHC